MTPNRHCVKCGGLVYLLPPHWPADPAFYICTRCGHKEVNCYEDNHKTPHHRMVLDAMWKDKNKARELDFGV